MNTQRPATLRALALTALLVASSAGPGRADGPLPVDPLSESRWSQSRPARVYTLVDHFENGRSAVHAFVNAFEADHPEADLRAVIRRCKQVCARIDVRSEHSDGAYRSVSGSGVLIDGGRRLLTAGHSLEGQEDYKIVITLADGQTREARPLEHEYDAYRGSTHDWAVLEIIGAPVDTLPTVWQGRIREGELALVLGYPDQIGIDAWGQMTYASDSPGEYLEPLVTLGVIERSEPLVLFPRAGSIPTGGISGGPVFDRRGGLIGIFVSISRTSGRTPALHLYNAASIRFLGDRLARQ